MSATTRSGAYTVLSEACEHTCEEKRSTFTALLLPVQEREAALDAVAKIRRERPGASHYCWAYVLGDTHQPAGQAFSDDGEPGGTAGKPMLHVLTQRGAGDCLAVVVRTFGGIKLGAGGLVRAYGNAVSRALDRAQLKAITPSTRLRIGADFAHEARVRQLLGELGLNVAREDYTDRVELTLSAPLDTLEDLERQLQSATAGQAQVRHLSD